MFTTGSSAYRLHSSTSDKPITAFEDTAEVPQPSAILVVDRSNRIAYHETMIYRMGLMYDTLISTSNMDLRRTAIAWAATLMLTGEVVNRCGNAYFKVQYIISTNQTTYVNRRVVCNEWKDICTTALNVVHDLLCDNAKLAFERFRGDYADMLIYNAVVRKTGDAEVVALENGCKVHLATTAYWMDADDIKRVRSNGMLLNNGSAFDSFGPDYLYDTAVIVSRVCPLVRSVGYGEYPCASESMSQYVEPSFPVEVNDYNMHNVSIMNAAARRYERRGEDVTAFTTMVLALQDNSINIATYGTYTDQAWFRAVTQLCDRFTTKMSGLSTGDHALHAARKVITWWKLKELRTPITDFPNSIADVEKWLLIFMTSIRIVGQDGDDITFACDELDINGIKFAPLALTLGY